VRGSNESAAASDQSLGPGDFLARVGLGFNETKTPAQLGTVTATFAETKSGTAGYNYIGVYGWSVNPLVEYYIVEDWFGNRPVPGRRLIPAGRSPSPTTSPSGPASST